MQLRGRRVCVRGDAAKKEPFFSKRYVIIRKRNDAAAHRPAADGRVVGVHGAASKAHAHGRAAGGLGGAQQCREVRPAPALGGCGWGLGAMEL